MKIDIPKDTDLSNAEVLAHLQEIRRRFNQQASARKTNPLKSGNLEVIMKELTDYLTSPPSYLAPATAPDLTKIDKLVDETVEFALTKAELLQIVNLRPDSVSVLDTIIEEMDARFSDEQQLKLLAIIKECLGGSYGQSDTNTLRMHGEEDGHLVQSKEGDK